MTFAMPRCAPRTFSPCSTIRFIGEPPALGTLHGDGGALLVINAVVLTVVVAEIELSEIAMQVSLADVLMDTIYEKKPSIVLVCTSPRTYSSSLCLTVPCEAKFQPITRALFIGHEIALAYLARLDQANYPTGVTASDDELANVNITRCDFHGQWNYAIAPRPSLTQSSHNCCTATKRSNPDAAATDSCDSVQG